MSYNLSMTSNMLLMTPNIVIVDVLQFVYDIKHVVDGTKYKFYKLIVLLIEEK